MNSIFGNGSIKVKDLPVNNIQQGSNYIILSNNTNYVTHAMHKYPAKFIPHIPRWAIAKYAVQDAVLRILDPFCGSGTTLLEGAIRGHHVIGVDIDPLARLVSKVKTTLICPIRLSQVLEEIRRISAKKKKGAFYPQTKNLTHWFPKRNIQELCILRDCVEQFQKEEDVYDFLIVTLSSIIRKVSNADDQSQKTYVSHTHLKYPPAALPAFFQTFEENINRMSELKTLFNGHKPVVRIYEKLSATDLHIGIPENSIDLAVTSPPYIKALDYIYTQMAEYFWVGDLFSLDTQEKQNAYRRNYIGTKMIYKSEYKNLPKTGYRKINSLVSKINERDQKHAYIVADYFLKMEQNIRSVYKLLKRGRHYIVVVGNCEVSGYPIDVNRFIAEIGANNGFKLSNIFSYTIRNRFMRFPRNGRGGIITHDWIIDLKKK